MSAFIEEHRERFGVEPICETLGVSASAYYERASGRRSARRVEDERLLAHIREFHEANYLAYGSRRMWKALLRAGESVGRDRVARLMRQDGIQGAKRRGKPWRTTKPDPRAKRSPDLVEREFAASRLDELWFADFTYLRCWEGLVFFSFVIDAYSRRVDRLAVRRHMRTTLVLDALAMALHQRAPGADVELVHHSDAGSQYTSIDYTQTLDDHNVLHSIGSVGDAYDNAVAESFVDSFKTELIADRVWASRSQLELAVVQWSPGSTTSASTKTSATGHPERSRTSTLRKTGQPHTSDECWEPTNTVSVEPRTARGYFSIVGNRYSYLGHTQSDLETREETSGSHRRGGGSGAVSIEPGQHSLLEMTVSHGCLWGSAFTR